MNDEHKLSKDINYCVNCKRLEKELNEINNKLVHHSNLVYQLRKMLANFEQILKNITKNNQDDFKVPKIIIEDC